MDENQHLLEQLKQAHGPAIATVCGNPSSIDDLLDASSQFNALFGRIDVVIAGVRYLEARYILYHTAVSSRAESHAQRELDTNIMDTIRIFHTVFPWVYYAGGYMLSINSLAAFSPQSLAYGTAASMAGCLAYTDSIRIMVSGQGVAVGSVHPRRGPNPPANPANPTNSDTDSDSEIAAQVLAAIETRYNGASVQGWYLNGLVALRRAAQWGFK